MNSTTKLTTLLAKAEQTNSELAQIRGHGAAAGVRVEVDADGALIDLVLPESHRDMSATQLADAITGAQRQAVAAVSGQLQKLRVDFTDDQSVAQLITTALVESAASQTPPTPRRNVRVEYANLVVDYAVDYRAVRRFAATVRRFGATVRIDDQACRHALPMPLEPLFIRPRP